ncbi:MAG: EAL domain-containing protein [Burkholderiales bacterium]
MDIHLDPGAALYVRLALSLAVCTMAAQLALAWVELMPGNNLPARLRRLLGAGISLGTAIWSVHGMAAGSGPGASTNGVGAGAELSIWLLAMIAVMASLGGSDGRGARLSHRLMAGCALAASVVALQALGIVAGDGAPPLIEWRRLPLLAAGLACAAACAAAFGVCHVLRRHGRVGRTRGRMGAGALIGAAIVLSQHLVLRASPQTPDPSGLGAALALLAAVGVVLLSRQTLAQLLRSRSARDADRRRRGVLSPNDPLTGLPTRQLFEGALAQAVRKADAGQQRLALLLINLDGFKPINQTFGHLGGDQVLREVAARLRALAMPHMAARMGGDEFLMLLNGDPQPRDASALATDVIAALGAPYKVDGREATLSCSVGVAMYPEHGARTTMIVHAHAAMGAAKAGGGAGHALFEQRMIKGMRDDVDLLRDLRTALEHRQLELYYQPKIHAPSGEITGAEALLRWHHPQRGMISPAVFIPIAERYGLINAIGRWVIDEACRQTQAWRNEGLRMRVAINLSAHQLRQHDLAERIAAALQRHEVNPDLITCEVTESSAMDDTEVTMRVLGQLDRIGVRISIDDFGTGHSSLAYLRKLPADELKIDRSFVMDLETSEDARKVAVAVINLAKALNLKVVAEGVETEGQNRILREFGCDQLQGFLFAKPMSAKALALWAMDDVGPRAIGFRESLFKATRPAATPAST